jgi:uncharacterized protein (TIGR00290 family)
VKEPVAFCWSGGKDSALALFELRDSTQYEVVALVTTLTRDFERISMHGVRRELLLRQAAAVGLPVDEVWITQGASNAEYESEMGKMLESYRARGLNTVAFGDIFLEDLRMYRERNLAKLGMQAIFPIWKRNTRKLIDTFLSRGFRSITCCIDTGQLDDSFVGREIDQRFVDELPSGVDPCGENGEFHSYTCAGPLFDREIPVSRGEIVRKDSFLFCDLIPN